MSLPVRMADSVAPHDIPYLYRRAPNGVAAYADGRWAWSPHRFGFDRWWRICVTGDLGMAGLARVLDVETGDATPAHVAPYAEARHQDVGEPTVVYCDRSTVAAVVKADPAGWDELEWWISVGDSRPPSGYDWTPAFLADQLKHIYDVTIDPAKIRAIQRFGTGFDVSTVFGDPFWQPS